MISCNQNSPPMKISAILFDFDGTLTRPNAIDFAGIRKDIGCPEHQPILEYVDTLTQEQQRDANHVIDRYEMQAASKAEANVNAEATVATFHRRGMPMTILTRNNRSAVLRAFQNFDTLTPAAFKQIITRDDPFPHKPDPAAIHHVARSLAIPESELLCVGDYIFDVQAATAAGCPAVFLRNHSTKHSPPPETDHIINTLDELEGIIRETHNN